MHTPLPSNVLLKELGTSNTESRKDHSDHLPIWIRLTLTDDLPVVQARRPLSVEPRCDIDMHNKEEVKRYNEIIFKKFRSLPQKFHSLTSNNMPTVCPQLSRQCIASVLRHSVLTVEDKNGLDKRKKA